MIGLQKGRNNEAGACSIQAEIRFACTRLELDPMPEANCPPLGRILLR
jgi:hypothetical protein